MFLSSSIGAGCRRCYHSSRRNRWLEPTTLLRALSSVAADRQQFEAPILKPRGGSVVPKLLLSSPTQPEFRFVYEFTADHRIRKKAKVPLPETEDHFLFGSSQGYLFSVPNEPSPTHILAIDPLTGHRLYLPPLPHFQKLNIDLKCNVKPGSPTPDIRILDPGYGSVYDSRAVLSHSRDLLVLLRDGKPFFTRIEEDDAWTPLHVSLGGVADCFFHMGRLHAANYFGSLFVYNLSRRSLSQPFSSRLTSISYPLAQDKDFRLRLSRYFVASPDGRDLFFVLRGLYPVEKESYEFEDDDDGDYADYYNDWCDSLPWGEDPDEPPFRARHFRVFKFFEATRRWERVKSLGGLALFVGPGETMSLSASEFPAVLEPDCIYFTDDHRSNYWFQPQLMGDTGVFNLKDGSIRFYELEDGGLQLNWPPPLWFVPTAGDLLA